MRLARTHRRLAVLMSLAGLLAFGGGTGVQPAAVGITAISLLLAFFWQPSPELSARLERVWLPLALLLVARAVLHLFIIRDDFVIPVVDLLLLLLVAECLRSLDTLNDTRIYALSFALILAATAYRPGVLFFLAFLLYVGFGTLALLFGHLRRQSRRFGTGEIPVPPSFLLLAASLSMVVLVVSMVVFLVSPRTARGWSGRGNASATSIAGFADEVALGSHGSRIYGNPTIVLRVEFPNGAPTNLQSLYWRGRSYDHFDGMRWSRSPRIPPSLTPRSWLQNWGGEVVTQTIFGATLDHRVLFALHPLIDVEGESRIQPISDNAGDHLYWGFGAPVYTARSLAGRPEAPRLREAAGGFVPARDNYTQLPPLSPEIKALADSLLEGVSTDYDRVTALQNWFRREFTYTLDLPRTPEEATLQHFLLQRKAGHCEYFSTAMAVLLRSQGIAVREVNGFLGGDWSPLGNYLAVTQNHAHAWVEVWFPDFGWVPFDPTPADGGEASASASWLWPGHFLFDAIQHHWGKWVLDFSLEDQFNLFQWGSGESTPSNTEVSGSTGRDGRSLPLTGFWVVLAALVTLGAAYAVFRKGSRNSQATRMFLRLREAGRRAGVPAIALHSPLALTSFLESVHHPSAIEAKRVVDHYLHARFSGFPTSEDQESAMTEALEDAITSLRKNPVG